MELRTMKISPCVIAIAYYSAKHLVIHVDVVSSKHWREIEISSIGWSANFTQIFYTSKIFLLNSTLT